MGADNGPEGQVPKQENETAKEKDQARDDFVRGRIITGKRKIQVLGRAASLRCRYVRNADNRDVRVVNDCGGNGIVLGTNQDPNLKPPDSSKRQ